MSKQKNKSSRPRKVAAKQTGETTPFVIDSFEIQDRLDGPNNARINQMRRERLRRRRRREMARKRRRALLIVILIVILIVAYALGKTSKHTTFGSPSPSATVTASPKTGDAQKTSTKKISSKSSSDSSSKSTSQAGIEDMSESCTNYVNKDKGVCIPYPNEMTVDGVTNDKTLKSIETKSGDAAMIISAERVSVDSDVNTVLNKYASGIGVKTKDSYVDPDGEYYSIDFERSGEYKHRLGLIKDGYHIYYDFTYNIKTDKASTYKNYIAYIDDYLEDSVADAKASDAPKTSDADEDAEE